MTPLCFLWLCVSLMGRWVGLRFVAFADDARERLLSRGDRPTLLTVMGLFVSYQSPWVGPEKWPLGHAGFETPVIRGSKSSQVRTLAPPTHTFHAHKWHLMTIQS